MARDEGSCWRRSRRSKLLVFNGDDHPRRESVEYRLDVKQMVRGTRRPRYPAGTPRSIMLFLLGLAAYAAIAFVVALVGFMFSRRFVENRLRYVDAVQSPLAAFVAGGVAALVAPPAVAGLRLP